MTDDPLMIEGLAAQLYVESRLGQAFVWWHLLREDIKRGFRVIAKRRIADFSHD